MIEENWRQEIVLINEALQHLTKQKDKNKKALIKFQSGGHDTALITKSMAAFSLDPEQPKTKNLGNFSVNKYVLKGDSRKNIAI